MSDVVVYVSKEMALPDDRGWCNRFHVRSRRSRNLYVVSQNIKSRYWGCSCMGWIRHRTCEHLKELGLPVKMQPYEAQVQVK